ncbi:uncharacterized protein LY89DRAFT_740401 [Mollisia scopiformis]|uniref:Uncharacterized protein n=1 Tax=Mollisia scopiformis TaxID=149040 RepID=A0A132BC41_MOLSC|nr:uncharacterized protein LY89DRAFT_740401 [Mollisia scopiformis]KUJ09992.1 hypothetical protein LY89DRAFT_740401 [Mollisia scopiformis]
MDPSSFNGKTVWSWPRTQPVSFTEETQKGKSQSRFNTFEYWNYDLGSGIDPVLNAEIVEEDDFSTWLKRQPVIKSPSSSLRLVFFVQPIRSAIPFKKSNFETMCEIFGLPPVELHWASDQTGACGMFVTEGDEYTVICSQDINSSALACTIRYQSASNITSGYIRTSFPTEFQDLDLTSQYHACPHPILIPVLLIEYAVRNISVNMYNISSEVWKIKEQTMREDLPTVEYKKLSCRASDIAGKLIMKASALELNLLRLNTLEKKLAYMDTHLPSSSMQKLSTHSVALHSRIAFISNSVEHALLLREAWVERCRFSQSLLSDLIGLQNMSPVGQVVPVCPQCHPSAGSDGQPPRYEI